jgi:hypothetical protein
MEITNKYILFHPNYLASKRDQIKLEKLLKLSTDEYKRFLITPNKLKVWRVEDKKTKKYVPQDSRYNFKQIVKNFQLNREQIKHGYSNKYINLFTDLLYENTKHKYAKKRLFLVDFRKKILKNHLNTSFEDYIQKEPLSEQYNFSKQKINSIYLTQVINKGDRIKLRQKNRFNNFPTMRNKKYSLSNKILMKELSNDINLNDNNKYRFRFNTEGNSKDNFYIYSNSRKLIPFEENNNYNYLYGSKVCNTSSSDTNIKNRKKNNINNYNNGNKAKTIYNYTERNIEDENKYFENINAREEYLEGRNKAKYLDYLKKKYNFFTRNKSKDYKNYSEVKKRQLLYFDSKDKVEYHLEFPYKKEFFKKHNRMYKKKSKLDKDIQHK